jgi:hypothetical protein
MEDGPGDVADNERTVFETGGDKRREAVLDDMLLAANPEFHLSAKVANIVVVVAEESHELAVR